MFDISWFDRNKIASEQQFEQDGFGPCTHKMVENDSNIVYSP